MTDGGGGEGCAQPELSTASSRLSVAQAIERDCVGIGCLLQTDGEVALGGLLVALGALDGLGVGEPLGVPLGLDAGLAGSDPGAVQREPADHQGDDERDDAEGLEGHPCAPMHRSWRQTLRSQTPQQRLLGLPSISVEQS